MEDLRTLFGPNRLLLGLILSIFVCICLIQRQFHSINYMLNLVHGQVRIRRNLLFRLFRKEEPGELAMLLTVEWSGVLLQGTWNQSWQLREG